MHRTLPEFWLDADWPAPPGIRAGITTRPGGHSTPPYDSLNLAIHVGDHPRAVDSNRQSLEKYMGLPSAPLWLEQVHGKHIIEAGDWRAGITADACWTTETDKICAVQCADCLPLLLCDGNGSQVAALHLGWRGLCTDMLETAIALFPQPRSGILAWIGPHIRSRHYRVGDEVREACLKADPGMDHAFNFHRPGYWSADLAGMLRFRLDKLGISRVYDCDACTFAEPERFFSYRRDGITGRMASLIWME